MNVRENLNIGLKRNVTIMLPFDSNKQKFDTNSAAFGVSMETEYYIHYNYIFAYTTLINKLMLYNLIKYYCNME